MDGEEVVDCSFEVHGSDRKFPELYGPSEGDDVMFIESLLKQELNY